jgi:hypothetical protein
VNWSPRLTSGLVSMLDNSNPVHIKTYHFIKDTARACDPFYTKIDGVGINSIKSLQLP